MRPEPYNPNMTFEPRPFYLRVAREETLRFFAGRGPMPSTRLVAVKENGDEIFTLIRFTDRGVYAIRNARRRLESLGYDTSFSEWDENGALKFSQA